MDICFEPIRIGVYEYSSCVVISRLVLRMNSSHGRVRRKKTSSTLRLNLHRSRRPFSFGYSLRGKQPHAYRFTYTVQYSRTHLGFTHDDDGDGDFLIIFALAGWSLFERIQHSTITAGRRLTRNALYTVYVRAVLCRKLTNSMHNKQNIMVSPLSRMH